MQLDRVGGNGKFRIANQSLSLFSAYKLSVPDEMGLRDLELGTSQYQAAYARGAFILPGLDPPGISCCVGGMPSRFFGALAA